MYGRDPWGGPLEITAADTHTVEDRSRNLQHLHKRPLDETEQSWLLGPTVPKKKRYVNLGCVLISRKIFQWTLGTVLVATLLAAGSITFIVKAVGHHKHKPTETDTYTDALNKSLMFFNAQKCKFFNTLNISRFVY
ncbi:unnamed protein product [Cochlearia groenlandica]